MSGVLHPVGPQDQGVYWVRRALVLVVVLTLLLGVRWLLTGRGSSPDPGAAGPTSSPTAQSSPPAASPTTSASTKPTASSSAKPSASASGGVPLCADSDIAVTASTDAASYPVGATPRLRMRIANSSTVACRRNIGADVNELVITSGATAVWSSDDCNPDGNAQLATLAPGQSYSVSVTWLGRLSAKGCPASQPLAQKGTYKLVGRNGDVASPGAVFVLT